MLDAHGVTRRLLWSNGATILEWTPSQASADDVLSRAVAECGLARLAEAKMPGEACNPLLRPVRYIDESTIAVRRRVCCLRYLLPGEDHCGSLCLLPEVGKA